MAPRCFPPMASRNRPSLSLFLVAAVIAGHVGLLASGASAQSPDEMPPNTPPSFVGTETHRSVPENTEAGRM